MTFNALTPMLQVLDLRETLAFYTDVLGFGVEATFPIDGEPTWASVTSGDARVMFSYSPPHTHDDGEVHEPEAEFNGALYLYPEDLDAAHTRVASAGVSCSEIATMPWGMREFRLSDPNGYELILGQPSG